VSRCVRGLPAGVLREHAGVLRWHDGKEGELIGPVHLEARAPATPGPATLQIPEFGSALTLQVFDASAVNDVRIVDVPGQFREGGKTSVMMRFLVNGIVPCKSPAVPVEITMAIERAGG